MIGTRLPTCRLRAVGSNPMYAVTGPSSKRAHRGLVGALLDEAAPLEGVVDVAFEFAVHRHAS
jgi:hypothetical protein